MTSIKIIRERERETERNLEQHALLSAAYSLVQQHHDSHGLSAFGLGTGESYSWLAAHHMGPRGREGREIRFYAWRVDSEPDLDILKSAMAQAGNAHLSAMVISSGSMEKWDEIGAEFPADILIVHHPDESWIDVRPLTEGGKEASPFTEERYGILDNFPHPYTGDLDPLILFRFLSMNNARTGKASLSSAVRHAAVEAYIVSVNQDRERIRSELTNLVHDMDRAGVLTLKGNDIYFPRNSERFEKTFIRRYWDYMERMGKRTLFDFETPF